MLGCINRSLACKARDVISVLWLGDGKAEKLCAVLWIALQERSGQIGTSPGEAVRIIRGVENKTYKQ